MKLAKLCLRMHEATDLKKVLNKTFKLEILGFESLTDWKITKDPSGMISVKSGDTRLLSAPVDFFMKSKNDGKVRLAFLTLPTDKTQSQVNLLAPLELDAESLTGKQVIDRKNKKSAREPAFDILKDNGIKL